MSAYSDALADAMTVCGQHPDSVFLGQAVAYGGTAMSATFANVDRAKLLEMPVAEEMQMGMAIGMSLAGALPICVYPRWNFLILATNQLVNHLDKIPIFSDYRPKVIIRVGIGSPHPLDPGPQHLGDFSDAFCNMLRTVRIYRIERPEDAVPSYRRALERDGSTILVEDMAMYG